MKFGGMVATKIDDWQIFPELERLGYDHGWAPDSQMIWSDSYATLALAAHHTSRIRLGTGVAIAGTRLAPVTAHSIASINKLAPGRTFLGIGTGHTAMRIMGQRPMKAAAFREYLRVLRALLHGQEVDYAMPGGDGEARPIRFLDRELESVNTDQPVPVYVAANGPKALAAAGAYGDGRICAGNEPLGVLARNLERVEAGAAEVGRSLPGDFHTASLTFACVLKPGETTNYAWSDYEALQLKEVMALLPEHATIPTGTEDPLVSAGTVPVEEWFTEGADKAKMRASIGRTFNAYVAARGLGGFISAMGKMYVVAKNSPNPKAAYDELYNVAHAYNTGSWRSAETKDLTFSDAGYKWLKNLEE